MELIGGLSFLGHYMNSRQDKKNLDTDNNEILDDNSDNCDMYSRNMFTKANKKYKELSDKKFNESKSPKQTGVIPKYYNISDIENKKHEMNYELFTENADSQFSDEEFDRSDRSSCYSNNSIDMDNPTFFLDKSNKVIDNRKHERKFVKKVKDENNFLRQFDDLTYDNTRDPVSINAVPEQSGIHSNISRMENEREMALNGGFSNFGESDDMKYNVVDNEHFTHNNMKPFFKKGANSLSREHVAEISQRKMELFSGLEREGWEHKKEQEPLFSPVTNITNTNGMPVMTDYYQGRYIPGKEKRNELPFQQIKVAPGLGLGIKGGGNYSSGSGDLYRVLPKTVDELRPLNKPKITYEGVVVPGQKGTNGPIMGTVEKRRPDKFKKNDSKDMIKTYGYINAPMITGEINPNTMGRNRGLKQKMQVGPAQYQIDQPTTDDMRGNYKKSFKQTFLEAEPRNIHLIDGLQGRSTSQDEIYVPKITQRGQDNTYTGHIGNTNLDKGYTFDVVSNIPELTKRNIHDENNRNGNITGNTINVKTINYNDVPDSNMRTIHNKSDRIGNITGNNNQTIAFDSTDIPYLTMRDIHNQYDRSGSAVTGGMLKGQSIDYTELPEQTKRDIHNQYDRNGKAIRGDYMKGQYIDQTDIPDQTKRDIHNQYDRNGKAIGGDYKKGQSIDYTDIPDQTKRDIYKHNRGGNIKENKNDFKYINYNDIPDITFREVLQYNDVGPMNNEVKNTYMINYDNATPVVTNREITGETNRINPVKQEVSNSYIINYDNATPVVTNREITGETNRINPAKSEINAPRNRRDILNSKVNKTREIIAKGRTPTIISYDKGPTNEFTIHRFKCPDQLEREHTISSLLQTTNRLPIKVSKNRNETLYENNRLDSHIKENLENNPYINNIIHKSYITYK